jgi:hypothetical protein
MTETKQSTSDVGIDDMWRKEMNKTVTEKVITEIERNQSETKNSSWTYLFLSQGTDSFVTIETISKQEPIGLFAVQLCGERPA